MAWRVLQILMDLLEDIVSISDLSHVHYVAESPGHFNRRLMCSNVPQLVRQNTCKFVVIAGKRDEFTTNVDPTACDAERVYFSQIHEIEAELQLGDGQMLN